MADEKYMKNRIFKNHNFSGFSLVEVIIAAAILAMASTSVFQLFIFSTRSTRTIYNHSTALNLAVISMDQVAAAGPSGVPAMSSVEYPMEKNKFKAETRVIKLSKDLYQVEVKVSYRELGRDVELPLSMIMEE